MQTKGFSSLLFLQWQKIRKHRKPIIISCALILWIGGVGLVSFNALLTSNGLADKLLEQHMGQKALVGVIPSPSFRPSPTPTPSPSPTPTQVPLPAPITPFPTTLNAQVATMERSNRFFYSGNKTLPEIALTFDDGPNPPYTSEILNILQRYSIKASFFCVGQNAQNYPELVNQEYREGNVVGNHTWNHPYLPYLAPASLIWQFTTTAHMLQHTTGVYPSFFRPPYGAFNQITLKYLNSYGLSVFLWNDDPQDWARPGVRLIVSRALAEASNGGIILMHDGGGDRSETVAALPIIIEALRARGYNFVTLKQLAEHQQNAGTQVPIPQGTPPPAVEPTTVVSSSGTASLPIWKPQA